MSHDEITCREFVEVLTDYLEGALDDRTLTHVEEHLVLCDWCEDYAGQMDATIETLGNLSDAEPPPPAGLTDAIAAALRERKA
jgi:predicted anti-sigma-YlaC factor YlaD